MYKPQSHAQATVFVILITGVLFTSALAKTIHYTADTSDFPNPERGFYIQANVSQYSLQQARANQNITVVRTYFRLDDYVNAPIPQSFLDNLENDFQIVRSAGAKIIPRFSYNFGREGTDAPESQILEHIEQLAPILARNYDVIVHMNAGFIGAWGEWHSSDFGLDNTISRRNILYKLLSALPPERMVNLRYNYHKRAIFQTDLPLSKDTAYTGSYRARTGALNDCLGASANDWGTYEKDIEWEKQYLSQDNRFVVQEGETCNPDPVYSTCDSMLKDLERMRWDLLNSGYHQQVLESWVNDGCMDEVQRKLGYRIRLTEGFVDDSVSDGTLNATLGLVNEGWGKIFNPRGMELVLRNALSEEEFAFPLPHDPRLWGPGDSVTVHIQLPIPNFVPLGEYHLFLHLPDTVPSLYGRPHYSIRLANQGVWEDSTGYNSLQHTVHITAHGQVNTNTIPNASTPIPHKFLLRQTQSSGGSLEIVLEVPQTTRVTATLFNMQGELVSKLASKVLHAGVHHVDWDGYNHTEVFPNNLYLLLLESQGHIHIEQILLVQ
jgi:hypothetical protein